MKISDENILEFTSKFENQREGACCKCEFKGNFPIIANKTPSSKIGILGHIIGVSLLFAGLVVGLIYYWFRDQIRDYYDLVVCPNCFAEMCSKLTDEGLLGFLSTPPPLPFTVFSPVSELKINDEPASKKILEEFLQHFKTNNELKKYKSQFSSDEINKKSSKTENVFFQTSEEKGNTVSSNKKSEEVPAKTENVFFQTSEEKGNTVSSNKKSEEVPAKTENVFFQTSEEKGNTVSSNKKSEGTSISIKKRLKDLLDLKENDLINGDDYEIKKKEILKDL